MSRNTYKSHKTLLQNELQTQSAVWYDVYYIAFIQINVVELERGQEERELALMWYIVRVIP